MIQQSFPIIALALGMRHGVDPDHLAAIDGLSRMHPSRWNGLLFAAGHGFFVTLLAAGIGGLMVNGLGAISPVLLIGVGAFNLYRVFRPSLPNLAPRRLLSGSPLLLGVIFAAGFETASQLSALALVNGKNGWTTGLIFSMGMIVVDGVDGCLAAGTQRAAASGYGSAIAAGRIMSLFVAVSSFFLGGAELANLNIDSMALPLGLFMFTVVAGLRLFSRRSARADSAAG